MIDALYRTAYRTLAFVARGVFFFVRPNFRGVAVAVWHDDRLLLVRNSYRSDYGLPGGFARRSEDPAEAATRELLEETGISIPAARLSDAGRVEVFHSNVNDHVHFFETRISEAIEPSVDRREVVWADYRRPDAPLDRPLWIPLRVWLAKRSGDERQWRDE